MQSTKFPTNIILDGLPLVRVSLRIMKRLFLRITFAISFFAAMLSAFAQQDKKPTPYERGTMQYKGHNAIRDIVYKTTADGQKLEMDIILPKEKLYKNGAPVVLQIHGGGWHSGDRFHLGGDVAYYDKKGVATATVSYRLISLEKGITMVDCIKDVKDAARFLAKNAKKYGLDASRIAVWGHSAGGHLSLMEVLTSNKDFVDDKDLAKYEPKFVCAVGLAPIVSFVNPKANDLTTTDNTIRFGKGNKDSKEIAELVSPICYLKKDSVPLFIVQGDRDTLVDVASARIFVDKAKKIGAKVKYLEIANAWHDFNYGLKGNSKNPKDRDTTKKPSVPHSKIVKDRHAFIDEYLLDGIEEL